MLKKGGRAVFLWADAAAVERFWGEDMAYMRLGDLLVSTGAITEEQLHHALELQKGTKQRLGDVLIQNGIITEKNLIEALKIQLGIEFIDLTSVTLPVELARFVPKNIARKYCVVPVRVSADTLYLAMSDPLDFVAQEEVKSASHKRVIPMIAARRAVEQAVSRLYSSEGTAKIVEEMKREVGVNTELAPQQNPQAGAEGGNSAPTIQFVNALIERAFDERASDIHLEPQAGEMIVRMRVDGLLRQVLTVPSDLKDMVVSRLKIMGNMDIAERRIPQDGHTTLTVKGHVLDLRISTLPTVYGEKLVLRLLDKSSQNLTKSGLGFEGADLEKFNALLKNSGGVILLVGPTGSGKSTTMCVMIQDLAREEVNIVTLEDPVEYYIPGVNQCQINEKTGMTFASGLRSILRQDPDVIAVGEIRDSETAHIAIRAAITGHLVLSTLHTNDAISAVARLRDMGVEPWLLSGALRGVISQRLVRKICPHCKKAYTAPPEELAALGLPEDGGKTVFYKGEGCPECHHTGYIGRRAALEILVVNSKLSNLIAKGAETDEMFAAARENGLTTMRESCQSLVLRGITTAEEAARVITSTASD